MLTVARARLRVEPWRVHGPKTLAKAVCRQRLPRTATADAADVLVAQGRRRRATSSPCQRSWLVRLVCQHLAETLEEAVADGAGEAGVAGPSCRSPMMRSKTGRAQMAPRSQATGDEIHVGEVLELVVATHALAVRKYIGAPLLAY